MTLYTVAATVEKYGYSKLIAFSVIRPDKLDARMFAEALLRRDEFNVLDISVSPVSEERLVEIACMPETVAALEQARVSDHE